MSTDPIADMLTRIRNGYLVKKSQVSVPYSKIKAELAGLLVKNNFLEKITLEGKGKDREIKLDLKYLKNKPAITKIVRISRPGRRVYQKRKDLRQVISGLGRAVISTSKGIMTAKQARKENLGGEIICKVW